MAIGSILVQPQKIVRATNANADTELLQDLLYLLSALAADVQQGGQVLLVMGAAFETTALRLQQSVTAGFSSAQAKLHVWISPVVARAQLLGESGAEAGTPTAALALANQLLTALASLAESLTLDQLRVHVKLFLDIIQHDLGLTPNFIEEQIWALLDDIITQLENVTSETPPAERNSRLAVACLLRRFKRRFQDAFEFPQLDIEFVAGELLAVVRQLGLDGTLQQVACALTGMSSALEAGTLLTEFVPFASTGNLSPGELPAPPSRSIRAARGPEADPDSADKSRYAWWATWLLQYKYREIPLFATSDLKDAKRLLNKVKSPSDAMSRFLRDQLKEGERTAIDGYDGTSAPPDALKLTLIDMLNRLLRGEGDALSTTLFHSERFPRVTFAEATNDLSTEYAERRELIRFNRMVLEDALPDEFEQLPRSRSSRFGSWLGEWLRRSVLLWPGDRVAVDKTGTRVMLGDKVLFTGENVEWQQAPIFDLQVLPAGQRFYLFDHFKPDTLDNWALATSVLADTARLIIHATQVQSRHQVAPLLNLGYDFAHALTSLAAHKPFSGFDFWGHKALEWPGLSGTPFWLTTLGSIQGRHTEANFGNKMAYWFTVWLNDVLYQLGNLNFLGVVHLFGPISLVNTSRNAILTFMTLLNMGGPRSGSSELPPSPAQNHKEIQGIVDLSILGFTYLLAKQVRRQEYVNPAGANGKVLALWFAGSAGMGLVAGAAGALVAEIIAWAEDFPLLGWTMLEAILPSFALFWPMVYLAREGDTEDGRFNPAGGRFRGYPTKKRANGTATPSPYLLPYASGTTLVCGQGNAGMWSHNVIFNPTPAQTYAYDFAHDFGEEILASRSGTIVAMFEGTPDNTVAGGAWNFVVVRHDRDDSGNPAAPNPDHDRDVAGNVVFTYAVYGHGRQNGVTNALARWTTPPATIIGTVVKRGQPLMLADDTGTSFHNHLHMHVQAETAGSPAQPPVADNRNGAYTLPFIFQDVGGDGVCSHGNWYTSTNPRILA